MSIQRKVANWRRISHSCAGRVTDYGALIPIELAETKTRMLQEVVALVTLAIGALFTLSFISIAVIVKAVDTPHLVLTGAWRAHGSRFR